MASLNLAGKTSGYVKLTAPDDSSTNPTVTLPTESGELALKSDIGSGGGDSATLESIGIPNHDKLIVKKNGDIQAQKETTNTVGFDLKTLGLKADKTSGVFNSWSSAFYNSNGEIPTFGQIRVKAEDTTKGSEKGSVSFWNMNNGTLTQTINIASDGRVDITGSLYVNGSPKSLDVMVTELEKDVKLKDKLIEKLEARLDKLEAKLKK